MYELYQTPDDMQAFALPCVGPIKRHKDPRDMHPMYESLVMSSQEVKRMFYGLLLLAALGPRQA